MAAEVAARRNDGSRPSPAASGWLWRAAAAGLLLWLAAASPAQAEASANEIREIEALLVRLGFTPGRVDGIADAETEAAIRDYQSFASLPVNGQPSQGLLDELRGVMDAMPAVQDGGFVASAPLPAGVPAARGVASVPPELLVGASARAPAKAPAEVPDAAPLQLVVLDPAGQPVAPGETAAGAAGEAATGPTEEAWEFALHLASFKEPGSIRQEWQRLQHQLPKLLGDMTPRVHRVTLDDQGVLFRLYAGPFPNLATAKELCIMISLEGYRCGVEDRGAAAPAPTTQVVSLGLDPATAGKLGDLGATLVVAAGTQQSGLSEGDLAARAALARSDFDTATAAFQTGDCERAVSLYGRALESGGLPLTLLTAGRNNRGRCLFELARYQEAVAEFDLAIELEPEFAAAYFNRGRVHKAAGNDLLAEEDMRRAYDLGFGRLGDTQ